MSAGMNESTEERLVMALERISSAVVMQAESNAKLAEAFGKMERGMMRMVGTISGAQRKIGGELGAVIERGKAVNRELAIEHDRLRGVADADS